MAHDVLKWPQSVYPNEIDEECPDAREIIDVLIMKMRAFGPSPEGYNVKNLGKRKGGLWQVNLKVEKRQVRILYAPFKEKIVLFRIHKKGSPQEQERAYGLAQARKIQYEKTQEQAEREKHGGSRTIH